MNSEDENMNVFKHFDLRCVSPAFDSPLTNLIIELDYLRKKKLYGSTPPIIFFQLKNIFHILESVASARIEGNRTTVVDYIEKKREEPEFPGNEFIEIQNMEECLGFIEQNINNSKIDRAFVSELHKLVVKGLPSGRAEEGDKTPGVYRLTPIKISGSSHIPPAPATIPSYMDELFDFINKQDQPKYDLLKTAIVHHRFTWIHPFNNGNGRTVRMLTYAMIVKYGFNVDKGRIINPAAIFCSNRTDYYQKLSIADEGTDEGLLDWSEFVLHGLKNELQKIDKLLEYEYLKNEILIPTINYSLEREWITELESKILKKTIDKKTVKASDLDGIIKSKHAAERSRVIRRLREKKMIIPIRANKRIYSICFSNNFLTRGIIKLLMDKEFISDS
jgi:Fic family protein